MFLIYGTRKLYQLETAGVLVSATVTWYFGHCLALPKPNITFQSQQIQHKSSACAPSLQTFSGRITRDEDYGSGIA